MTGKSWEPAKCNETAGFLFDHPCNAAADTECARCGRPVCDTHARDDDTGEPICISCAKLELKDLGRSQRRRGRGYGRHSRWRDDDPYFYGGYHYHGWGFYGSGYWGHNSYNQAMDGGDIDFTEGDSEPLFDNEPMDFESDMSES